MSCLSQTNDPLKKSVNRTPDIVSFITRLDIAHATKEGMYLNGYVVNIGFEQAQKLNGKKIRVTGKVTILKGLKNRPGDTIRQGRYEDTEYIDSPHIIIIRN